MKKLLLLILISASVVSCSDGGEPVIWDFVNPNIELTVKNAAGNDLLDKNVEGNIMNNDITITYKGNSYSIVNDGAYPDQMTKATMPVVLGLRLCERNGEVVLAFGEFSPMENYSGEIFTINWGDGTTTEIKFDLSVTYRGKNRPTVNHKLHINGVSVNSNQLYGEIIK